MLSNLIVLFSIIMSRWILPFIQVNELACHSSRDTDRRRETPGSEKSDFMIPPILGRAETSASFLCSHIMGGFMGSQIKPVWTVYCTLRGFCTQRDPEFTESVIFMFIIFAQNETLSQLFSISRCTNIQRRKKKRTWVKEQSEPCNINVLIHIRMQEALGKLPHNNGLLNQYIYIYIQICAVPSFLFLIVWDHLCFFLHPIIQKMFHFNNLYKK